MLHSQAKVHRMFELVEPIATITYSAGPNDAFLALGMRTYWTGTSPAGPRRWDWCRPRWCTRSSTTSPTAK
jgi:hypothetical protein